MRRELWETLVDLMESMAVPEARVLGLRVTDVTLDLPVEIVLQPTEVGFKFLAGPPMWRQETGLQHQKGRMSVRMTITESPEQNPQK